MKHRRAFAAAALGIALIAGVFYFFLKAGGYQKYFTQKTAHEAEEKTPPALKLFTYIEITDSCNYGYIGTCAVARFAPATSSPSALKLRTGIVLEVAATTTQSDGHTWYKILFSEPVRYPERIAGDWYVASDSVRVFKDTGNSELKLNESTATSSRHILIDRSDEMLYAYDGDVLFMKTPASTGLDLTPTPRGIFHVYKKTPTRYMQGPLPGISDQYYDLPGVPWDLYFTQEGGAIHGAYWHNGFGTEWSHGCVNLPLEAARMLYAWTPLGTEVIVRD